MWYVKNEFQDKVFYKSNDVIKTQNFVNWYNRNFKFAGQRMFHFVIYDFCGFALFGTDKVDINGFLACNGFFTSVKYSHPLSVRDYHVKHLKYRQNKYNLICKLAKKYHVWSFNEYGRKCDSFDF